MNSIWAWIRWAIQILENVFQFCYVNRSRIQSKSWSQCTRSSLPTTRFVLMSHWLKWNSKFLIFNIMVYLFQSTCRKSSRHTNTGWTRSNSSYMYAISFSKRSCVPIFLILIKKFTTFLIRSELSCYDWNPNSRGNWSNGIHFGSCTLRSRVNSLSKICTLTTLNVVCFSFLDVGAVLAFLAVLTAWR